MSRSKRVLTIICNTTPLGGEAHVKGAMTIGESLKSLAKTGRNASKLILPTNYVITPNMLESIEHSVRSEHEAGVSDVFAYMKNQTDIDLQQQHIILEIANLLKQGDIAQMADYLFNKVPIPKATGLLSVHDFHLRSLSSVYNGAIKYFGRDGIVHGGMAYAPQQTGEDRMRGLLNVVGKYEEPFTILSPTDIAAIRSFKIEQALSMNILCLEQNDLSNQMTAHAVGLTGDDKNIQCHVATDAGSLGELIAQYGQHIVTPVTTVSSTQATNLAKDATRKTTVIVLPPDLGEFRKCLAILKKKNCKAELWLLGSGDDIEHEFAVLNHEIGMCVDSIIDCCKETNLDKEQMLQIIEDILGKEENEKYEKRMELDAIMSTAIENITGDQRKEYAGVYRGVIWSAIDNAISLQIGEKFSEHRHYLQSGTHGPSEIEKLIEESKSDFFVTTNTLFFEAYSALKKSKIVADERVLDQTYFPGFDIKTYEESDKLGSLIEEIISSQENSDSRYM